MSAHGCPVRERSRRSHRGRHPRSYGSAQDACRPHLQHRPLRSSGGAGGLEAAQVPGSRHRLSLPNRALPRSEEIVDAADGSGFELIRLVQLKRLEATPTDEALVSAEVAKIVREGVPGELTLASLKKFDKRYKAAVRNMDPATRPSRSSSRT